MDIRDYTFKKDGDEYIVEGYRSSNPPSLSIEYHDKEKGSTVMVIALLLFVCAIPFAGEWRSLIVLMMLITFVAGMALTTSYSIVRLMVDDNVIAEHCEYNEAEFDRIVCQLRDEIKKL